VSAEAVLGAHGTRNPTLPARRIGAYPLVDELCAQMAEVCASAVDPLEVAAALEFEGLGDEAVRERYGYPDVFALANELFNRVPRAPAEPDVAHRTERTPVQAVLRSLLYGLPAVCFPAAGGLLSGRSALTVLVVSVLASWSMSQGLAHLAYVRLGWAGPAQAHRQLCASLAIGLPVMALTMALTALAVPAGVAPFIFGFGQGVYVLSASAMMVLGLERVVLAALAPGVFAASLFLLLGQPAVLRYPVWVVLAATPVTALCLAVGYPRRRSGAAAAGGRLFVGSDLLAAAPRVAFGLLAPGLVVLPILTGLFVPARAGGPDEALILAAIPLSLSMGGAEWCMSWYRGTALRLLRTTRLPGGFGRQSRLAVLGSLLRYLCIAAILTGAAVLVTLWFGPVSLGGSTMLGLLAFLALGGAIYLSSLLHSFDRCWVSVLACAAALGCELASHGWGVFAQVISYLGLLALLATYAATVLGRVAAHAR
jgi:hypothetical protein